MNAHMDNGGEHGNVVSGIDSLKSRFRTLACDDAKYRDERIGRMVCAEALSALTEGNYGVGGVLADPNGQIVTRGHNQAFSPRFRSDRHCEMVIMDAFEAEHPDVVNMRGYTLFTSLEPCSMCVSRIIISGIGTVKYVAVDEGGGMARRLDALPDNFRRLVQKQTFVLAQCSPELRQLARDIFLLNLRDLQAKLQQRRALKPGDISEVALSGDNPGIADLVPSQWEMLLEQMRSALTARPSGKDESDGEFRFLVRLWKSRKEDDAAWRSSTKPYTYLGRRLLNLGAASLAKEVAQTALAYAEVLPDEIEQREWKNDVHLRLILGSSLARTANPEEAENVLLELYNELRMSEDRQLDTDQKYLWQETLGLLGRTFKDQADQATTGATKNEFLQRSFEFYERAYRLTGGYWTGINVATLALRRGHETRAFEVARNVRDQCSAELKVLPSTARDDRYWILATLGEASLILREFDDAAEYYKEACKSATKDFGNFNSTRRHARWLLEHWQKDLSLLDEWLPIPAVVVFTGHMIDRPGRSPERFPARLDAQVKATIKDWLQRHPKARVGFSSAACGSDILFQEALHEVGGECHLVLPYEEDEFVRDSVDIIPGAGWGQRFINVLNNAVDVVRASRTQLISGSASYDFANTLIAGLAKRRAAELETSSVGLAVWNGQPGDGPGGTASVIARWKQHGLSVYRVDLSQLPSASDAPLPVIAETATESAGAITSPPADPDAAVMTLLFADVVAFSRLPDREVPLFVRRFLRGVADLLKSYKVATRETWGDGLFFAFESLRDGGLFALELIDLVRNFNWRELGFSRSLTLRVALHAGPIYPSFDPITELPKVIGTHVTRAARLEPRTPPGEIYASEAFAALAALENVVDFRCDYVKQLELDKRYGTFPTYVVRRRSATSVERELEGIMLEKLAEAHHEVFWENMLRDGWVLNPVRNEKEKKHPLLVPYFQLPERYKESNRMAVRRIPTKLAAVGYRLIPLTDDSLQPQFTTEEIEKLAELEHEMWMADALARGFTVGDQTEKEPMKNPHLVEWKDLAERVREIDRGLSRDIPAILHKARFSICRQPWH